MAGKCFQFTQHGSCEFISESVCVCLTVRLTGFLTGLEIRCKARSQSTLSPPHTCTQAKISKTETLYVLPLYCEMEAGINMHTCVLICFSVLRSHCCTQTLSGHSVCVCVCLLHFCTALLLFGLRAVTSDERTHTFLQCLCLYVTGPSFFVHSFFFYFFKTVVHPFSPACLHISFYLPSFSVCPSLSISFPASLPYLFFSFFLRWCLLMETDLSGSEKYSSKPNIYPQA